MTKKMKRVAFDSLPYCSYEDPKARFKHQNLMQDYQELQEEVAASRNKLETMKQRKLTLLAEVRFLQRRRKFLLKNKSPKPPQERALVKPQYLDTQHKKGNKERIHTKKEATSRNLPPIFNLNQQGRVLMEKKKVLPDLTPVFDLNHKDALHGVKESALHKATQASNLYHRVRTYGGKEVALWKQPMPIADLSQKERMLNGGAALRNPPPPVFDLNQKENTFSSKEAAIQCRAPTFDLNQILCEEEEFQEKCEPFSFEESKKGMIRVGMDEQNNDVKLTVCRNIGDGSKSRRPGKRTISWQDPVALRV